MNALSKIALLFLLSLSATVQQAQTTTPFETAARTSAGVDGKEMSGADGEPVHVSGDVAQKLESSFSWGQCIPYINPARLSGVVEGELTISPEGKVIGVKDTKTMLARVCHGVSDVANISAWGFKPYLVDGKPVAMRVTVHFDIAPGNTHRSYK